MKTNMLDKVGTYEFLAEPFHCDFTKKLFIGHLGNHLLNAADFHATERGFGMDSLNLDNKTVGAFALGNRNDRKAQGIRPLQCGNMD